MITEDCGCPQNSPSQLSCPPSISIPADQFICPETNAPSTSSSVTFHRSSSAFVLPITGQRSSIIVADGAKFIPGQWVQFVNPSAILRITSIVGNTLELLNAAADGLTAITGNPTPPLQYPVGAAFVTVGDPRQQTPTAFATAVQEAISSLQSVCLNNISSKSSSEEVFLLGYLKSSACEDSNGSCLRKQGLAYIDKEGVLHFDGSIVANAFNVPVPEGGLPSSSPNVNPNNGTGGGFLLPLYNPATGQVSYINLFSGKENNKPYHISLNASGQLSILEINEEFYWPHKQIHRGSGASYGGFPAEDIVIADIIEKAIPSWVKYAKVRIHGNLFSSASDAIRVKLNTQTVLFTSMNGDFRGTYDQTFTVPVTDGTFNLEIVTYNDANGTSPSAANMGTGVNAAEGYIRVALEALLP